MASTARSLMLVVAALGVLPADAAEPCLGRSPLRAAQEFHRRQRDFLHAEVASLAALVTPALAAAIAAEQACPSGELCAIDADPWTAAQDGEMKAPFRYRLIEADDLRAEVQVIYEFALEPLRHERRSAALRLERTAASSCWRVDDVVAPDGVGLRQRIAAFARQPAGAAGATSR